MSGPGTGASRHAARGRDRFARLTGFDRMYLRDESAAWPCHFGGLAIVEGGPLLNASGQLRLAEIMDRLALRLARVPELRRRVYLPGRLRGGPLWVDDDRFSIEHHVHETAVDAPGGDDQLLETASRIYATLLDRSRPLWELWFLTGLGDGRVGVLLKLHHAVADGTAAVAVMGSLFDVEADAPDPMPAPWAPGPIPGGWPLLTDNVAGKARAVGRGVAMLAHPRQVAGTVRTFALVTRRSLGRTSAPRTSLNRVVRAGRRVAFLRLDLAAMKEAAHAHGGKLNDVVLDLWTGGLRRLLLSRGESVAGVELVAGMAVSTRAAADGTVDNQAGTIVLPLPAWQADAQRRLDLIVRRTGRAKSVPRAAAIMGAMVALSATPIGRYVNLHQRAVNVLVTNVVGPPVPMYVFGARILDIVPIIQLIGNIALTLCAFSYAGRVYLVVTADARGFPDLDVLMTGMEREWQALLGDRAAEPVPA